MVVSPGAPRARHAEELRLPQDELASAVSDKKNNQQNHEYHE
jgi:hypothetical protein